MDLWLRIRKPWWATLLTAWFLYAPVAAEVIPSSSSPTAEPATDNNFQTRLGTIVGLVEESNAPNLIGNERWRELLTMYRPAIECALSHRAFAEMLNALFSACGVSHFHYYTDEEWNYWYLRSTFEKHNPLVHIAHIGVFPQLIGSRWFVRGILEGSAAAASDIRVGDELVAVDGVPFEPIASFRDKAGKQVRLLLRRKPDVVFEIAVTPVRESLYDAIQRAVLRSVRVMERPDYKYAYLHGWTLLGDGDEYWKLLEMQDDVDGLILDYRDGFGGLVGRGNGFLFGPLGEHRHWTKPAVILIADGTRSAKEILVNEAQRRNRAPLVGTPTPGEVTSVAAVRPVGTDGLLMLPAWCHELERRPTLPDYLVERDIRFCANADPQLDRAEEVLAELILSSKSVPVKSEECGR